MSKLEQLIQEFCSNGVEYKELGQVCIIETGTQLNKEKLLKDGLYPVINGGVEPSGFWNEYNSSENSITISQGGASAGFVNWQYSPFWVGAHCYVVKNISNEVNKRFLFHFLKKNQTRLVSSQQGAGIPSLSRNPVPAGED